MGAVRAVMRGLLSFRLHRQDGSVEYLALPASQGAKAGAAISAISPGRGYGIQ